MTHKLDQGGNERCDGALVEAKSNDGKKNYKRGKRQTSAPKTVCWNRDLSGGKLRSLLKTVRQAWVRQLRQRGGTNTNESTVNPSDIRWRQDLNWNTKKAGPGKKKVKKKVTVVRMMFRHTGNFSKNTPKRRGNLERRGIGDDGGETPKRSYASKDIKPFSKHWE